MNVFPGLLAVVGSVEFEGCKGKAWSCTTVVAGVPYSHGLCPLAQGPHIGLTSSHLVWRFRQMVHPVFVRRPLPRDFLGFLVLPVTPLVADNIEAARLLWQCLALKDPQKRNGCSLCVDAWCNSTRGREGLDFGVSAATCGERLPATCRKASRSLPHLFFHQVDGACCPSVFSECTTYWSLKSGRRRRFGKPCPARKNRNCDANLTKYVFRDALSRTAYSSIADEWQSKMLSARGRRRCQT
jgi:hypothetical protein